ncbi:MAG: nuclear transport factor 2 family protein [Elusimicrobia bacterium]|nr:nuclear transport factor 2 family protein [Elusimicrobiota bacterium]
MDMVTLWRWLWPVRSRLARGLAVGSAFPDFALRDTGGAEHRLSSGGPTALWFTNFCEDCRAKVPLLNGAADSGLRVLAVSILAPGDPLPAATAPQCRFPVLLDPDDLVGTRLGLAHPPGTCPIHNFFLVDAGGEIRFKHHLSALTLAVAAGAWAHEEHAAAARAAALEEGVAKALAAYRAAFEARSTDKLAEVVDPALLVLEGTGKNVGWADYRDNHIGPEMKEWESLSYADTVVLDAQAKGDSAWAVTQATVTIVSGGKPMTLDVAETFVLEKKDGAWRIRHLHWSGKRRMK